MSDICREDNMPDRRTVGLWREKDEAFNSRFARARELGFDFIAEECLEIADNTDEGEETTTKADGGTETKRGDMLGHRKLRIETRLKLLAKWDPKRFGDKLDVTSAGAQLVPTTTQVTIVRPVDDDE